jgi:inverted formin-2
LKALNFVHSIFRISVEQLNNEINTLDKRMKKIKKQVELPSTDDDIKTQMNKFLEVKDKNWKTRNNI